MRKRAHWPIFVGAGAIETIAGGARAEELPHAMGNAERI
jgi:hypothetical protein